MKSEISKTEKPVPTNNYRYVDKNINEAIEHLQ